MRAALPERSSALKIVNVAPRLKCSWLRLASPSRHTQLPAAVEGPNLSFASFDLWHCVAMQESWAEGSEAPWCRVRGGPEPRAQRHRARRRPRANQVSLQPEASIITNIMVPHSQYGSIKYVKIVAHSSWPGRAGLAVSSSCSTPAPPASHLSVHAAEPAPRRRQILPEKFMCDSVFAGAGGGSQEHAGLRMQVVGKYFET